MTPLTILSLAESIRLQFQNTHPAGSANVLEQKGVEAQPSDSVSDSGQITGHAYGRTMQAAVQMDQDRKGKMTDEELQEIVDVFMVDMSDSDLTGIIG